MAHSFLKYLLFIALIGGLIPPQPACAQKKKAKTPAKTAAPKTPKLDYGELRSKADEALKEYRFEEARKLYQEITDRGLSEDNDLVFLLQSCDEGINMLSRVENIAIIDSITVDSAQFIQAIRLSPSSGRLEPSSSLPDELKKIAPAKWSEGTANGIDPTIFVAESGDMIIWPTTDADGFSKMVVSHRLADGSWETPAPLGEAIDHKADALWEDIGFPFLMPDGTTLYFASNSDEGGLGGWDIYVTRDNGNGFLEPQNVGMPYNSPSNDFMMAIDEVTGAGWWATDRNQIPGKLTIYVFVPQELRINYPVDTPDLIDRAKITRIAGTGATQEHNERVLAAIRDLDNPSISRPIKADFNFALPGGRILHNLDDFKSNAAASVMQRYLQARDELLLNEDRLAELRRSPEANTTHRSEILELEKTIPAMRISVMKLANEVVRTETGK